MLPIEFTDGTVGEISESAFNWIAKTPPSKFNPDLWKWIESLSGCQKITVKVNRFVWHYYSNMINSTGEVLQQNNGEIFCTIYFEEFEAIKNSKGKS